jgi:hypothetical protein
MRLIVAIVLIGAGIYTLYTAYEAYLSSGREVVRLVLKGGGAKVATVHLDSAMNPLRVVLDVGYATTYRASNPVLFESEVTVSNNAGTPVWTARTSRRDDRSDHSDQYGEDTLQTALGDFTISGAGAYGVSWSLAPKTAQIRSASLTLRAGAVPVDWPRTALGGALLGVGLVSLFIRRRGRGSAA